MIPPQSVDIPRPRAGAARIAAMTLALLALVIGATVMLLIVCELALAVKYRQFDEKRETAAYAASLPADAYSGKFDLQRLFEETKTPYRWAPYVYFRHQATAGRYVTVGQDGIRRTWQPEHPKSGMPVRVFLFGGSALWGIGARDEFTIPSLLAKFAYERLQQPVTVINFAEHGYVSTQEFITLLRELQRGNRPDVAIFFDGFNDAYAAFQSGEAGITHNEYNRVSEFNILNGKRRADLFRESIRALYLSRFARGLTARLGHVRRGVPAAPAPTLIRDTVNTYAANVKAVRALADSNGFTTAFYWQPTVFTKTIVTPYEQQRLRENGDLKEFVFGVNKEVVTALAGAPGFEDTGAALHKYQRTAFVDVVHTTEAANAVLAERIYGGLEKLLLARPRNF